MDRVNEYGQLIQKTLDYYAQIPYSHGDIKSHVIADWINHHFMLVIIGWDGKYRVHGMITHAQIIEGKIWIHRDGIEDGITEKLLEAGVPKSDIVLGFHPPDIRPHTGFAIA